MVVRAAEITFCKFELLATRLHPFKHIFVNEDQKKNNTIFDQTIFSVSKHIMPKKFNAR